MYLLLMGLSLGLSVSSFPRPIPHLVTKLRRNSTTKSMNEEVPAHEWQQKVKHVIKD